MSVKYKKRADGRYLIQVQIGVKENGKPQYKNIYAKTIRELEEKAAVYRQELEKGMVVDDRGLTVAVWSKKWLETYKAGVELKTSQMYENAVNNHIIPVLGRYTLKQLRPHHIQELINELADKGLTRTLHIIKITLNQILEQAVDNGYMYKNIASKIILPTYQKPKKRSLTDAEKKYILAADLPLKEKAFVYTLLYTGLRKGEALALTVDDVDMENRTIDVNKTIVVQSNQATIKPRPKSLAGNRTVPIIDELYPILLEHLSRLEGTYLFTSAKGTLMSHSAFARMWTKILNAFKVACIADSDTNALDIANDITPHIFRHSYATMLYYAGVDIKTAQYLLGHSSIQMTMDIYTHLDTRQTLNAADKLNTYMSAITSTAPANID